MAMVSPSRAITRRYRLEQADDAYAALSRGEIVGRAIVTMADGSPMDC